MVIIIQIKMSDIPMKKVFEINSKLTNQDKKQSVITPRNISSTLTLKSLCHISLPFWPCFPTLNACSNGSNMLVKHYQTLLDATCLTHLNSTIKHVG